MTSSSGPVAGEDPAVLGTSQGGGDAGGLGTLPMTGLDILRLVMVALALICGGQFLLGAARRRRGEVV